MVRPSNLENEILAGKRQACARIVEDSRFVKFITGLIIINAVNLGLETNTQIMSAYGGFLHSFDILVISIFVLELALKIYAYRWDFFKVGWNIFDFIIVAVSLVPHSAGFAILRSLRIFRLFRLITVVPQMRSVIGALFHAIPGMASIICILLVFLYVFAVLAVQIFGQHHDPVLQQYFGSISNSMYTMFQLMTLEDWPDIANPTMKYFPWAWTFFIPFIIITTFAVLNLFIGIMVDALHIVKEQDTKKVETDLLDEIRILNRKLDVVQKDIAEIQEQYR